MQIFAKFCLLPVLCALSHLGMFFHISLHEKQIRAWDSPNWRLGPNRGFKFGCHLGSNSINFQTWSNYLPKRSTLSVDYENVIFWSVEVTWPQIRGIWGHLGSSGLKTKTFSNQDKLYIKMKLLIPWLRKSGFRGRPTPGDLRSFGVKIKNFWNLDSSYTKMKLLLTW